MADLISFIPAAESKLLFYFPPHKFKLQRDLRSQFRRNPQGFQYNSICHQFLFFFRKSSCFQPGKALVQLSFSAGYTDLCLALPDIICHADINIISRGFYQGIICDLLVLFSGHML